MEPESSLLSSQEPTTVYYHAPDESYPHPHPVSLRSTLVLSSHLYLSPK